MLFKCTVRKCIEIKSQCQRMCVEKIYCYIILLYYKYNIISHNEWKLLRVYRKKCDAFYIFHVLFFGLRVTLCTDVQQDETI